MKYYDYKTGKVNTIDTVEVRVDGKFRRSDNKRIMNVCTKSRQYPEISIQNNKKRVKYLVHVSILSTFGNIKDISGIHKLCVDHINRNKQDYSLNNLRFVTTSENNLNREKFSGNNEYCIVFNKCDLEIKNIYKIKDIKFSKLRKNLKDLYSLCIVSDNLFKKLKEDNIIDLVLFLYSLNWKKIDENFSISDKGIVKMCNSNHTKYSNIDRFTLGTMGNMYYRIGKEISGHSRLVHILVAEMFLNNGNKIENGLVVDHIDTNKLNNSVKNLRIVTQSQNMKNELTRSKILVPIKCMYHNKIIYFRGITICASIIGVDFRIVSNWVRKTRNNTVLPDFSNFQYLTDSEINNTEIKYIETKEDLLNI